MKRAELIKALRQLKIETGSFACMGCGREHNCSTQGCAIIRAAVEELEKPETMPSWIPVEEDEPPTSLTLLLSVRDPNPAYGLYTTAGWKGASWHSTFGTPIDQDSITHWMFLPEPPEVGR